jgi:alpha-galactosidase
VICPYTEPMCPGNGLVWRAPAPAQVGFAVAAVAATIVPVRCGADHQAAVRLRLWRIVLTLIVGGAISVACTAQPAPATPPPQTPPMGWNSWNSGIPLSEQSIEATIDAMVASGMRDAGYRYVNLDAGWAAPRRDAAGNMQADPARFPGGIPAVARYAHDRGMFLGLYSSPYNQTCGQDPRIAGVGHEVADARTFAAWGIDYLKYDWCRPDANHPDQVKVFTAMRDALRASGRRIIYSINPNVDGDPTAGSRYDWSAIADMSRDTIDLVPVWESTAATVVDGARSSQRFTGVRDQLAAAAPVAGRSQPGHWNDPDMLVVGIGWPQFVGAHPNKLWKRALAGTLTPDQVDQIYHRQPLTRDVIALIGAQRPSLTDDEQRAHFSLWAMLAAPLIAGNDVRSMSEQTRAFLTNRDIIAVDQDPLVHQGTALPGDSRILAKQLADGSVAVALFNTASQPASIATSVGALGLGAASCYTVRDLWAHSAGTTSGNIDGGNIPAHGVTVLRVSPGCR